MTPSRRMMMWKVLSLTGLSLTVLMLSAWPAASQDRLDAVVAAVERRTATPAAEAVDVNRMARFLGTTADALRAERASTRLGWGDLFLSHRIATRGGHPIEKVFAARRTGAPWGQIAEEARVDAEALVQDIAAVWPDAARATPSSGETARPTSPAPAQPPAATAAGPPRGETKGLGRRLLDAVRGTPSATGPDAPRPDERDDDRAREEIRDRMIRGGGRNW